MIRDLKIEIRVILKNFGLFISRNAFIQFELENMEISVCQEENYFANAQ